MTIQPILPELQVGARVQHPLIVLDLEARGGDTPHTILIFGNASGKLPSAPFWASDGRKIAGVVRGSVVEVSGVVSSYRDRRQLAVEALRVLPANQVDLRRLMPCVSDVPGLWARLDRTRAGLGNGHPGRIVGMFFDDPGFRAQYEMCPASVAGHHARLGGLLQHTVEVAGIATEIARHHTTWVNPDVVVAGALLHDIGKLESYRWKGAFDHTVPGSVIGHVVLGARMLDRRARAESPMPCTEEELLALEHILLSHHGQLEFGSPVQPMNLEAEIIHQADNASAKTASMADALEDADNFPGGVAISARTIWQLDRRRAWRAGGDQGRDTGGK